MAKAKTLMARPGEKLLTTEGDASRKTRKNAMLPAALFRLRSECVPDQDHEDRRRKIGGL